MNDPKKISKFLTSEINFISKDNLDDNEFNEVLQTTFFAIVKKNFDSYCAKRNNLLSLDDIDTYLEKFDNPIFTHKIKNKIISKIEVKYDVDSEKFDTFWDEKLSQREEMKEQAKIEIVKYQNDIRLSKGIELLKF